MKPLKLLILLTVLNSAGELLAQQEPLFTQHDRNRVLYNPATAGMGETGEIGLAHHRQWLALPEQTSLFRTFDMPANGHSLRGIAPVTSAFHLNMPVVQTDCGRQQTAAGGIFVSAITDRLAFEENRRFSAGFAYQVRLSADWNMRTGLAVQWLSRSFRTENLRAMTNPDPLIPAGTNPSDQHANMAAGVVLAAPRKNGLWFGMAVSSLLKRDFVYPNLGSGLTRITQVPHFYLNGGLTLLRRNLEFSPMWMVRMSSGGGGPVYPQFDIQSLITWKSRISAGGGFRFQAGNMLGGAESLQFLMAFFPGRTSRNIRIGYSYDLTLQSLRRNSGGTHAIQLNFIPGRKAVIELRRKCMGIDHPRRLDKNPYPAF